jgi:hypothetical protein
LRAAQTSFYFWLYKKPGALILWLFLTPNEPGIATIGVGTNLLHEPIAGYKSITPAQIVDYLSLTGDAVDNVPGVDKVGPKTRRNGFSSSVRSTQ